MVAAGEVRAGTAAFLAGQPWTSPLLGAPGFLQAISATVLSVNTTSPTKFCTPCDPSRRLRAPRKIKGSKTHPRRAGIPSAARGFNLA